jgi:dihydropteroate synthase
MGILNVTPDSFSDGGEFVAVDAAVAQAERMVGEGAALVDVGGESTRPGAEPVRLDEELRRVEPVLERIAGRLPTSIDTSKAEVARRAIALGTGFVNDVTALRGDPEMAGVVAEAGGGVCLMHMRGDPRTMQEDPRYEDVVSEVKAFLEERVRFAIDAGVAEDRIWIDPGIGFGKTVGHNLELIARLEEIAAIGRPVLVGVSRKRFIGEFAGDREAGTVAANVLAFERGASMFRVHEVAPSVGALALAAATFR